VRISHSRATVRRARQASFLFTTGPQAVSPGRGFVHYHNLWMRSLSLLPLFFANGGGSLQASWLLFHRLKAGLIDNASSIVISY
jgi:hypothetical protein